ncbi:MAG: DNA (cytosine-5-)-methyltransferase [Gemmatimonadaceae bacterium]
MDFIDLFAGLGGFHVALTRLRHSCVFASEIEPDLRALYERNFGMRPAGDIRAIGIEEIPSHDILCAGFPCQPFSKAGSQRGFDCPRSGDLFSHILRILHGHRPSYFILENVTNLLRHDGGRTWRNMLGALREEGYTVDYSKRSPHHDGVPQARERLFIVGVRAGLAGMVWPRKFDAPVAIETFLDRKPSDGQPVSPLKVRVLEIWQDFLDQYPKDQELPSFPIWTAEFGATYPFEGATPWSTGIAHLGRFRGTHGQRLSELEGGDIWAALPGYARTSEPHFPHWKERFIRLNRQFYARNKVWIDQWLGRLSGLAPSHQKLEWNFKGGERSIWNHLVQFRASGIRVKQATSAPTLVAMNSTQVPVVAWERRYMTTQECARIQGLAILRHLPSKAEKAYRALGNAVNAEVAYRIAEALVGESSVTGMVPERRKSSHQHRLRREKRGMMGTANRDDRINIRPPVNVLSVLRHLNYQPWYAFAEFVDNALQSYLSNRKELQAVDGRSAQLRVSVSIDSADDGRILIRDNAAGIAKADYARAFRAAEVPPDRSGLSEFGMGMKSAACWFAPHWSVRTKALSETVERTVTFDINAIVRDSIEELEIRSQRSKPEAHYTEIVLSQVYKLPQKRTLGKIHDHLASMYRIFLREGTMDLTINGIRLAHELPKVLVTPFYKTPSGKPVKWHKEIDIDLGGRKRVTGFAALRERGSTIDSGFALFRRKRVITGTADQGYRPESIFGRSNSYVYQRLFGELHLTAFDVSHTKDGFRWDEDEEAFLEELKRQLDAKPVPLIQQANGFRAKPSKEEMQRAAETVVDDIAETLRERLPDTLDTLDVLEPEVRPPDDFSKVRLKDVIRRLISVERHGSCWEIVLEACYDESMTDWIEVMTQSPERGVRRLGVRLSLAHPFTERFAGEDPDALEPLMRIAAAFGLAETTAREVGVKKAGTVRVHFNELIREAMTRD